LSAHKHSVCSVYFAVQRAAGQLAQSHNFQRSSKNTQHLPRFEPLLSQLTSLVTCGRARQSVGPRRPIANPIDNRFCFQSTRSQTCVSTLNQMVARNWKICCHRGRVDQGQRLNICFRTWSDGSIRLLLTELRGGERVFQQHGDSHRADAARHRCDG